MKAILVAALAALVLAINPAHADTEVDGHTILDAAGISQPQGIAPKLFTGWDASLGNPVQTWAAPDSAKQEMIAPSALASFAGFLATFATSADPRTMGGMFKILAWVVLCSVTLHHGMRAAANGVLTPGFGARIVAAIIVFQFIAGALPGLLISACDDLTDRVGLTSADSTTSDSETLLIQLRIGSYEAWGVRTAQAAAAQVAARVGATDTKGLAAHYVQVFQTGFLTYNGAKTDDDTALARAIRDHVHESLPNGNSAKLAGLAGYDLDTQLRQGGGTLLLAVGEDILHSSPGATAAEVVDVATAWSKLGLSWDGGDKAASATHDTMETSGNLAHDLGLIFEVNTPPPDGVIAYNRDIEKLRKFLGVAAGLAAVTVWALPLACWSAAIWLVVEGGPSKLVGVASGAAAILLTFAFQVGFSAFFLAGSLTATSTTEQASATPSILSFASFLSGIGNDIWWAGAVICVAAPAAGMAIAAGGGIVGSRAVKDALASNSTPTSWNSTFGGGGGGGNGPSGGGGGGGQGGGSGSSGGGSAPKDNGGQPPMSSSRRKAL